MRLTQIVAFPLCQPRQLQGAGEAITICYLLLPFHKQHRELPGNRQQDMEFSARKAFRQSQGRHDNENTRQRSILVHICNHKTRKGKKMVKSKISDLHA